MVYISQCKFLEPNAKNNTATTTISKPAKVTTKKKKLKEQGKANGKKKPKKSEKAEGKAKKNKKDKSKKKDNAKAEKKVPLSELQEKIF